MSRVDIIESTDHANFKERGPTQALGNWKEYEAFRFPFPMHQAALYNDSDTVAEYLHSKNGCYRVDINALDSCGRTVTHICAMESHVMLLAFILARRPNLEIKDCDVRPIVRHLLPFVRCVDILIYFFIFFLGLDCIALGHRHDNRSSIAQRRLPPKPSESCQSDLTIEFQWLSFLTFFCSQVGWTPLHVACYNSQLEITQLLLDEGADPNFPDLVSACAHMLFPAS
jgi:ankyrin repeat protein